MFRRETELAAPVVQWLRKRGWTVYQEVSAGFGLADIVAVKSEKVWVIECKLSVTFHLVGQARRWLPCAQEVSVAVPYEMLYRRGMRAAFECLGALGVGVVLVDNCSGGRPRVDVEKESKNTKYDPEISQRHLLSCLHERQQNYAPAGSAGQHWTPFKETVENLKAHVAAHPGCTMREAVSQIQHHYRKPEYAVRFLTGLFEDWIGKHRGRPCPLAGIQLVSKGRKGLVLEPVDA